MSTPKKKPAASKAKPAKKPAARQIPPPPPGWEIVGKDDPRLRKLPCRPMAFDPEFPRSGWSKSGYDVGDCIASGFCKTLHYALPIAKPAQPTQSAQPQPPMIRLRLPSEKPTREDADVNGWVHIFWSTGECDVSRWEVPFSKNVVAWLPGRLPDGILPREPTQEEKWLVEFEAWLDKESPSCTAYAREAAWAGFLAAKKGGAE